MFYNWEFIGYGLLVIEVYWLWVIGYRLLKVDSIKVIVYSLLFIDSLEFMGYSLKDTV